MDRWELYSPVGAVLATSEAPFDNIADGVFTRFAPDWTEGVKIEVTGFAANVQRIAALFDPPVEMDDANRPVPAQYLDLQMDGTFMQFSQAHREDVIRQIIVDTAQGLDTEYTRVCPSLVRLLTEQILARGAL